MRDDPGRSASWTDRIAAQLRNWLRALADRAAQWRLAVRLMTSALAAHVLVHLLGLPQGYWAVITAIIVIQSNVGGSLKAARDRLLATLLGALCGLLAVVMLPPSGPAGIGTFLLALIPTTLASAANPIFRIAPVTAAMMLMSPSHLPPLELGFERVLEIALGGVVGIGVALTVLPARAHRDLRDAARDVLGQMALMFEPLLNGLSGARDEAALRLRHRKIRTMIVKLEGLAEEARRERLARLTEERDPDALVAIIRRLHTSFLLLGRATLRPLPEAAAAILDKPLRDAAAGLRDDLTAVAQAVVRREPPPDPARVDTALRLIDESLGELRAAGVMRTLTIEQLQSLYAVAFAFGQFRRDLIELHARAGGMEAGTP
ncbi:MAG TPA: FUSC family protein [Geminicoccus sp.]|uniref:FUSC family protein n=1 Tax=Geminicoccus sp. TaxID=2024832 RepID=UPI002C74D98D|nr:FUSC family protein [Geminicoccus sp.]HWL70123.1 FUSC family protein [Geminicoccus sp.]